MKDSKQREWIEILNSQIDFENKKNKLNFKACSGCGDNGYTMILEKNNDIYYMSITPCVCASGVQLRERWNRKEESK